MGTPTRQVERGGPGATYRLAEAHRVRTTDEPAQFIALAAGTRLLDFGIADGSDAGILHRLRVLDGRSVGQMVIIGPDERPDGAGHRILELWPPDWLVSASAAVSFPRARPRS